MTWVFTDDHANESEQLCDAGGHAAWYHTCGHAFCRRKEPSRRIAGERLDFIPAVASLGLFAPYTTAQARSYVAALVRVGLWLEVPGGYVLADWVKVYGSGGAPPAKPAPDQPPPASDQPRLVQRNQQAGKARASQASRGPAGRFQPTGPATTSQAVQPSQPRASGDPVPVPEIVTRNAAAKELKTSAREPATIQPEAAAAVPVLDIHERAEAVQADPSLASAARPHTWPELLSVARAWHMRSSPRLGEYEVDADVRALVGLLAAGWPPDDLVALGAEIGSWLATDTPDGRPRTLSMVTPAVLRIAQEQAARAAQVAAEARELVKATA